MQVEFPLRDPERRCETFAPSSDGALVANVAQVEQAGQSGVVLAVSNPAALRVDCSGQLGVVKSWAGGCAVLDPSPNDGVQPAPFRVSITVTNDGKVGLANVRVGDWVPSCALVSNLGAGACSAETGHLSWTISDEDTKLPIGATRTVGFDLTLGGRVTAGELHLDRAFATADGMVAQTSNLVAGVALGCDDGDLCTIDSCQPLVGCVHTLEPIAGARDATCDGVDDDCDGATDDEFVGLPTTCGTGVCATTGRENCVRGDAGGTVVDSCRPRAKPSDFDNTCNNQDDDCDGQTDDAFVAEETSCGVGACYAIGKRVCLGGVVSDTCEPLAASAEVCDARDNDCDGVTDEGYDRVGEACDGDDTDRCPLGALACSEDHLGVACVETAHQIEVCNGVDDTCNGVADETFVTLGHPCDGADDDACPQGVIICDPEDDAQTTCGEAGPGLFERCNGRDDNCDGLADETFRFEGLAVGSACDGGDEGTCARGVVVCNEAGTAALCDETGLDPTSSACSVGLGVCKRDGHLACDGRCDVALSATPSAELCNGLDDNCDGVTDNGSALDTSVCQDLETEILTGPPPLTSSTTAVFTYINPRAVPIASHTTFECRLDDEDWLVCNHEGALPALTYPGLTPGEHTLLVRATRADGGFDPTPDIWTWVIDSTIPDTVILTAPTDPSSDPSGTFVFGSPTPNPDHYRCVLDPAAATINAATGCPATGHPSYQVCPETFPYTDLADGSHTICVYVVDTKGDVDPLPASHTWVIDRTLPETEITGQPTKVTSATTAVFTYIDPDAPATDTFECRLDGGDWTPCDGKTHTYSGLSDGEHTFEVRTVDAHGNRDPTPASTTWSVCAANGGLALTCSDALMAEAAPDACGWSGQVQALLRDGCDNELEVFVDGSYAIGTWPVLFTASDDAGHTAECITPLTVRDVTTPLVSCGSAVGAIPTVIRATATDACGALVTLENVACARVEDGTPTPLALASCPITVTGDTLAVTGRLAEGTLAITYDARAVDPSGNVALTTCDATYDPDQDGDGVLDADDNCVATPNGDQRDLDGDGPGDLCDVCPVVSDPTQADQDHDGIGDACADRDQDGVLDADDNCPLTPNTDQRDTDRDSLGDVCDPSPYEGLVAQGNGGCAGGTAGALGGLAVAAALAGLGLMRRGRRPSRDDPKGCPQN